jgi:hypothetical protein
MAWTLSQNGAKLTLQKVILSQPEGSRKKGRPELRRFDGVLKHVKLLEVYAWWKKALDRNIWGRGGIINYYRARIIIIIINYFSVDSFAEQPSRFTAKPYSTDLK